MAKMGIDDLRMELFDTLQRLKSANDRNCSANEKCTVEEAEAVCHIAKEIRRRIRCNSRRWDCLQKQKIPTAFRQ